MAGPPPPPPPAPAVSISSAAPAGKPKDLLKAIEKGKKLKKVEVNDRSTPAISANNVAASTSSSNSSNINRRGSLTSVSASKIPQSGGAQLGGLFAGGMPKLRASGSTLVNAGASSSSVASSEQTIGSGNHLSPTLALETTNSASASSVSSVAGKKPPALPPTMPKSTSAATSKTTLKQPTAPALSSKSPAFPAPAAPVTPTIPFPSSSASSSGPAITQTAASPGTLKKPPPPVPTRPRSASQSQTVSKSNAEPSVAFVSKLAAPPPSTQTLASGGNISRPLPPPPPSRTGAPQMAPSRSFNSLSDASLSVPSSRQPTIARQQTSPMADRKIISNPVSTAANPQVSIISAPNPQSPTGPQLEMEGRWKFHSPEELPPPRSYGSERRIYQSGALSGSSFTMDSLLSLASLSSRSPAMGRKTGDQSGVRRPPPPAPPSKKPSTPPVRAPPPVPPR